MLLEAPFCRSGIITFLQSWLDTPSSAMHTTLLGVTHAYCIYCSTLIDRRSALLLECCRHLHSARASAPVRASEPGKRAAGQVQACLRGADMRLLAQGVLRKGQEVEVRPGIVSRDSEGRATCVPIYSRIITLLAEQNELQYAVPGGLIGVGTTASLPAIASLSLTITDSPTTMHLPETVAILTQHFPFGAFHTVRHQQADVLHFRVYLLKLFS